MITIDGVEFEQTQGGLNITYETVRSSNYGTNQYGEMIGTTLGVRVHISITTNQLTEEQAYKLMQATAYQSEGFLISFYFANELRTMLFVQEGERSFTYKNQKLGKYMPTTMSFVSKELLPSV